MKDSSVFFACFINTRAVPMKINCNKKFDNYKSADEYLDKELGLPIERNNSYHTTIIPLCKHIPHFFNQMRAYSKATNILLVKDNEST